MIFRSFKSSASSARTIFFSVWSSVLIETILPSSSRTCCPCMRSYLNKFSFRNSAFASIRSITESRGNVSSMRYTSQQLPEVVHAFGQQRLFCLSSVVKLMSVKFQNRFCIFGDQIGLVRFFSALAVDPNQKDPQNKAQGWSLPLVFFWIPSFSPNKASYCLFFDFENKNTTAFPHFLLLTMTMNPSTIGSLLKEEDAASSLQSPYSGPHDNPSTYFYRSVHFIFCITLF